MVRRIQRFAQARNQRQQTALHVALASAVRAANFGELDADAEEDVFATVQTLLDFGVPLEAADPSNANRTALHFAADLARPEILVLLLEAGADTSVVDDFGETPLHVLCRSPQHSDSDKSGGMLAKMLSFRADAHKLTGASESVVFLLVQQMLLALDFRENQSRLRSVNRELLRAAYNMLDAALDRARLARGGMSGSGAPRLGASGQARAAGGRLRGVLDGMNFLGADDSDDSDSDDDDGDGHAHGGGVGSDFGLGSVLRNRTGDFMFGGMSSRVIMDEVNRVSEAVREGGMEIAPGNKAQQRKLEKARRKAEKADRKQAAKAEKKQRRAAKEAGLEVDDPEKGGDNGGGGGKSAAAAAAEAAAELLSPLDVNHAAVTSGALTIRKLQGVRASPLSLLVNVIVILSRIARKGARALLPDPDNEFAVRYLIRAARVLLDHGAHLHAPMTELHRTGELSDGPQNAGEVVQEIVSARRGTILDVLVRNEIQLLVVHPRVQRELNAAWGPSFVFDRDAFPRRLRWIDVNYLDARAAVTGAATGGKVTGSAGGTISDGLHAGAGAPASSAAAIAAHARAAAAADPHSAHRAYRSLPQILYAQWGSRRRAFLCSAVVYVVWAIALSAVLLRSQLGAGDGNHLGGLISASNEVDGFGLAQSVRERVGVEPLAVDNDHVDFTNLADAKEAWLWLKGPLLDFAVSGGSARAGTSTATAGSADRLIGPARLRQFRVQKTAEACEAPEWAGKAGWVGNATSEDDDEEWLACVPRYVYNDDRVESTDPDPAGVDYTDPVEAGAFGGATFVAATNARYPEMGGFVVPIAYTLKEDLPFADNLTAFGNRTDLSAAEVMTVLEAANWIDSQTSAVIAEAALYNPSMNRFAVMRFTLEFSVSGLVSTHSDVNVVKLVGYEQPTDFLVLIIEAALLILWAVNFAREVYQVTHDARTWRRDVYNFFDAAGLILFAIVAGIRAINVITGSAILEDLAAQADASVSLVNATDQAAASADNLEAQAALFDPLWQLSWLQARERDFAALLLTVVWIGLLKFVRIIPDVGILIRIVKREIRDLAVFFTLYFALLLGTAFAMHTAVATDHPEFRTVGDSMMTLFRVSLGDLGFFDFFGHRDYVAAVLYIAYIILALVLLLNLLIAMLNQSYSDVLEEATFQYLSERAQLIHSYGSGADERRAQREELGSEKAVLEEAEAARAAAEAGPGGAAVAGAGVMRVASSADAFSILNALARHLGLFVAMGPDGRVAGASGIGGSAGDGGVGGAGLAGAGAAAAVADPKGKRGRAQKKAAKARQKAAKKGDSNADYAAAAASSPAGTVARGRPLAAHDSEDFPGQTLRVLLPPTAAQVAAVEEEVRRGRHKWKGRVNAAMAEAESRANGMRTGDGVLALLTARSAGGEVPAPLLTATSLAPPSGASVAAGLEAPQSRDFALRTVDLEAAAARQVSSVGKASAKKGKGSQSRAQAQALLHVAEQGLGPRQPSTLSLPFSAVIVDLGESRRLYCTGVRMESLQARNAPPAPREWVLQATNSPLAAARAAAAHTGAPISGPACKPYKDAAFEGRLARAVADPAWTTLLVHTNRERTRSIELGGAAAGVGGTKRDLFSGLDAGIGGGEKLSTISHVLETWAGIPTVVQQKAQTNAPLLPGAFRFFRVMQVGTSAKVHDHTLSFCGLELYGGLVDGLPVAGGGGAGSDKSAPKSTPSSLYSTPAEAAAFVESMAGDEVERAQVEAHGDGLEEEEDDDPMSELARQAAALEGPNSVLYQAVLAAIEHNAELTREVVRQRLEHVHQSVTTRQRAIEASVEVVRDHTPITDYAFVYGDVANSR